MQGSPAAHLLATTSRPLPSCSSVCSRKIAAFQSASAATRSSPSRQTTSSVSQPSRNRCRRAPSAGRHTRPLAALAGCRARRLQQVRLARCPPGPTARARAARRRAGPPAAAQTSAFAPGTKFAKRAESRSPHAQRQLLHRRCSVRTRRARVRETAAARRVVDQHVVDAARCTVDDEHQRAERRHDPVRAATRKRRPRRPRRQNTICATC